MPAGFEPWVVMMLPPGGFFMIGILLLIANWRDLRRVAGPRADAPIVLTRGAPLPTAKEPEAAAV
ncbi:MAG: hypothetical protein ACSLFK_05155, partial [Gemmatimonadaceae bacterium]